MPSIMEKLILVITINFYHLILSFAVTGTMSYWSTTSVKAQKVVTTLPSTTLLSPAAAAAVAAAAEMVAGVAEESSTPGAPALRVEAPQAV